MLSTDFFQNATHFNLCRRIIDLSRKLEYVKINLRFVRNTRNAADYRHRLLYQHTHDDEKNLRKKGKTYEMQKVAIVRNFLSNKTFEWSLLDAVSTTCALRRVPESSCASRARGDAGRGAAALPVPRAEGSATLGRSRRTGRPRVAYLHHGPSPVVPKTHARGTTAESARTGPGHLASVPSTTRVPRVPRTNRVWTPPAAYCVTAVLSQRRRVTTSRCRHELRGSDDSRRWSPRNTCPRDNALDSITVTRPFQGRSGRRDRNRTVNGTQPLARRFFGQPPPRAVVYGDAYAYLHVIVTNSVQIEWLTGGPSFQATRVQRHVVNVPSALRRI